VVAAEATDEFHRPETASGRARTWLAATVAVTVGAAVAGAALAPAGSARAPEELALLLFAGSSVHVASTAWFYTVAEVRAHVRQHQARYLWLPLGLITAACAIAVLLPREILYWLLLPYFGWQFLHFQKQNLGIASLAAASHHVRRLTAAERRALTATGLAGIAALTTRPSLLQLPIRPVLAAAFPFAAAAFAIGATAGIYSLTRRCPPQRPPGFVAAYLMALFFSVPVFVFGSPYAAVAGLTIAHGLQYLLLMGLVASGGSGGTGRLVRLAALTNIALLGGALLSVASDQLGAQSAVRALYGLFLGVVMAHFVIDAGLWRMRQEFPRAFLAARVPYLVPPGAGGQKYRRPIDRLPI
jgi:hypothetical protein